MRKGCLLRRCPANVMSPESTAVGVVDGVEPEQRWPLSTPSKPVRMTDQDAPLRE